MNTKRLYEKTQELRKAVAIIIMLANEKHPENKAPKKKIQELQEAILEGRRLCNEIRRTLNGRVPEEET